MYLHRNQEEHKEKELEEESKIALKVGHLSCVKSRG